MIVILAAVLALVGAACGRASTNIESTVNLSVTNITNTSVVPPQTVNTPPPPTNINYPPGYSY